MRLLYICDALAIYGGLERVLIEKANWLVEQGGYEVCLLTVNQGNHPICFPLHQNVLHEDLDIHFFEQYYLSFWRRLVRNLQLHRLFRERLASKIQEHAPDIIFVMSLKRKAMSLLSLSLILLVCPVILMVMAYCDGFMCGISSRL